MNEILKQTRRANGIALLMCACGVAVNLLLGELASAFGLPIYLDTVGTVAVAAMGGYLPGVIVGFVTNIIKSISSSFALYYGVLNVLIAVAAVYLSRRKWIKSFFGVLCSIMVFTFIGGGLGSLIPLFMEDLSYDSNTFTDVLYSSGLFNETGAMIASNILVDLIDKTVTVVLVVVILRLIPQRLYRYFRLELWMQSTAAKEDVEDSDFSEKSRRMSLRIKALVVVTVSMASISLIAGDICMRVYHKSIVRDRTEMAQSIARIAAYDIDGDMTEQYLNRGHKADGYTETEEQLAEILNSSENIAYLYVYKPMEDGFQVVFDIDTPDVYGELMGNVVPYNEEIKDCKPFFLRGEEVNAVIYNSKYGKLLTVYQRVFDSQGRCVCYVGVDVDMEQISLDEKSFLVEMIVIFLSFFILVVVICLWLMQYHIIFPVRSITRFADQFSSGGVSQENLDGYVRQFRKLDIHTGDEIEKLYLALCRMTLDQAEQTRSIRRLSDATLKMQDGLIITMADLVENRDSDTGAHIQKTAAYVKIIVEGLKKKGYYPEKITPKFMSDVVRSAPLHDVGKINIPDSVLNKPGKLTDEEYEIMKTHTTAGKLIMEHAIGTVEGDSYLKEARNMAAYHHERWDGKGYPEGLHGNVIPLSARIMAVADVFDALASPRVYKPAFPIEKALSIIEEGKGTQFDPKCVEVFLEALPEVKEVLKKYSKDV